MFFITNKLSAKSLLARKYSLIEEICLAMEPVLLFVERSDSGSEIQLDLCGVKSYKELH